MGERRSSAEATSAAVEAEASKQPRRSTAAPRRRRLTAASASSFPSSAASDAAAAPSESPVSERALRRRRQAALAIAAEGSVAALPHLPSATSQVTEEKEGETTPSHSTASTAASAPRRRLLSRPPTAPFAAAPSRPVLPGGHHQFGIQEVLSLLYSYLPRPILLRTSAPTPVLSPPSSPLPPHPVLVYDVYSRSVFSDFVVVVHTHSSRQMRHLAQALYKAAREADAASLNRSVLSIERRDADDWTLVDMGRILVHLFNAQRKPPTYGLDYHPIDLLQVSTLRGDAAVLEGEGQRRRMDGVLPGVVGPHPVMDNVERQFGDLRVPVDQYDTLRDHPQGKPQREGGVQVVEEVRVESGDLKEQSQRS